MTLNECLVCSRVALVRREANPTFIARLPGSYVVLGDAQYLLGYSLVLWPDHVEHLHDLSHDARRRFLVDLSILGEAIWRAMRPARINYSIAGGLVPHLHGHVFPRYADEPPALRDGPVGAYPREIREAPEHRFDQSKHRDLMERIAAELRSLDGAADI